MTIPRAHIHSMAPYPLANLETAASRDIISLSQNESFRPPSPKVEEAMKNAISQSMLYPDPDWTELRQAIAQTHSISQTLVLCGNGSLNLIAALAFVYSSSERAVLAPRHAYPFFRTAAETAGARFDTAPETEATVNVAALLEMVKPDTGIVFVANPGNPTGTRISKDGLLKLRRGLREDILLVIDEAYGEFSDHLEERCFDMVEEGNTVILRTFSKAYGMAGFRVGWGLFPEEIGIEVRKVLNPNNVSLLSQVTAIAAVQDHNYMRETCEQTISIRDEAMKKLRAAGFIIQPSFTNFLLIDCGGYNQAEDLDRALRSEGILLRSQAAAGLPHALRMTVSSSRSMDLAIRKMSEWRDSFCK